MMCAYLVIQLLTVNIQMICLRNKLAIAAIETALDYIKTFLHTFPSRNQNIVIFTDSLSALQSLENDTTDN